jgi:serine/threonine protein kinase
VATDGSGQDPLIGQTLGHYRVIEKIGSGGMGVIYRAQDEHLEREVAVKVLPPGTIADDHARKRFRNEALALSRLNHPNIATVFDFHSQQGRDFLVMELIKGVTLNHKLLGASLPEKDVIALGMQLAEGLSVAHDQGVIHRDLKPANLILTTDGRLKILDFGLAKLRMSSKSPLASETVTEPQTMAGTLAYMAPEQLLGGRD